MTGNVKLPERAAGRMFGVMHIRRLAGLARLATVCAASIVGAGCMRAGTGATPAPSVAIRLASREGFIETSDSVRLYYRVLGDAADTIVVLHGGPGFHSNYLIPDLTPFAAHHTLIFFDQRNAGRSSAVTDTARLNARWLVADVDAVRRYFHLGRLTILGHSWGGLLAGLYAASHGSDIDRLLLVAPSGPTQASERGYNAMARLDSAANAARLANQR